MPSYHHYVFDETTRQFIGDFESMYQAEEAEGFDSWHQDDLSTRNDIGMIFNALADSHYSIMVDLGCGKGVVTSKVAHITDRPIGLDVSPTAIRVALERFPSIEFKVADIGDSHELASEFQALGMPETGRSLILISQVLSYLHNWRTALETCLETRADVAVSLYLPPDPIGFVKDIGDLTIFMERPGRTLIRYESGKRRQHVLLSKCA